MFPKVSFDTFVNQTDNFSKPQKYIKENLNLFKFQEIHYKHPFFNLILFSCYPLFILRNSCNHLFGFKGNEHIIHISYRL